MGNVYAGLIALVMIIAIVSGAYFTGRSDANRANELANAKADQAQMDESREIKNAVEKLDDTGLRSGFDKLRNNRKN